MKACVQGALALGLLGTLLYILLCRQLGRAAVRVQSNAEFREFLRFLAWRRAQAASLAAGRSHPRGQAVQSAVSGAVNVADVEPGHAGDGALLGCYLVALEMGESTEERREFQVSVLFCNFGTDI